MGRRRAGATLPPGETVRRRVGVLGNAPSTGRDSSPTGAESCARALERLGHEVVRIPLDDELDRTLRQANLDAVFFARRDRRAEDGCVQGLLELLRIPYTGSGVLASALATDRLRSKEIFRLHNIATPPYYALGAAGAEHCAALHGSFGFPVVVKPRRAGSRVGVSIVHDAAELPGAVREALRHDDEALVERYIRGKEVCVGLLDGRVLGAIEVVAPDDSGDGSIPAPDRVEVRFPARLSPARCRCVLALAEQANRALGCTGASRVDLLVTEGDNEYVLDVNPLPETTPESLLARIAAGAGYDFDRLVAAILAGARLHAGGKTSNATAAAEEPPGNVVVPVRRRAAAGGRRPG